MSVEGLTIPEIAKILGVSVPTVKFRIVRAGIQPKTQAGRMNFYSEDVVELIKEPKKSGRPKKK
jgi:DNA-directed RNA polymerase specialized sigma24 family protein